MKKAAKAKEDPKDEQDEDSDAKYKDEAYDDGKPKGSRNGRGRGRGRSTTKGKSRGKGKGKPHGTTEEKAEEKKHQLSGDDDKGATDHAPPKCSNESKNEKTPSDQEGEKPMRASSSQEAVRGTPEKKKKRNPRKNTPLKGRSPKQIKKAVAETKKPTAQD